MDSRDLRRRTEDVLGWLRFFVEMTLDEIKDRLGGSPLKILAAGVAATVFLVIILMLFSSNQETKPDKPITMTREQAIQIAKQEYPYGKVNTTHLSSEIWFVEINLPLPILVPYSNKTTESVWVCVNGISGNVFILSSEGRFMRGEV